MRTFKPILFLKAGPVGKSIDYASYKSSALASLISESLYKWSDNFIFIHPRLVHRPLDMSGGLGQDWTHFANSSYF